MGQERGGSLNADALEKAPGPALAFAFASQIWLQVDKDWPGKLSRAVLICCYGYEEGKQFPVRYLLIISVGCWGRLAKLRGDTLGSAGDQMTFILTSYTGLPSASSVRGR